MNGYDSNVFIDIAYRKTTSPEMKNSKKKMENYKLENHFYGHYFGPTAPQLRQLICSKLRNHFFSIFQVSSLREPFLERVLVANTTRTRFKRVLVAIIPCFVG